MCLALARQRGGSALSVRASTPSAASTVRAPSLINSAMPLSRPRLPFSSPCPEAAACLPCVPAVLCPEMVNLLLDKAGFDVVKASSVPPGFNKQGTGENRGNIYYGR